MRRTLLLLSLVAAAVGTVWGLTRLADPDPEADGRPDSTPDSRGDACVRLLGRGHPAEPPTGTSFGSSVPVEPPPGWLPANVDVRVPEEADALLASLLEQEKVDWTRVGDLLAASSGPFSEATRSQLLRAVTGDERAAAARAVGRMRDGSLVPELLALYDSGRLEDGVRAGVLGILIELEGADSDRVAEALASRLRHEPRTDRELLNAIALRGGATAASILIDYLRWTRAQEPRVEFVMPSFRLAEDAAAREVLLAELARESSPELRVTLMRAVGQQGAIAAARALIDMDDGTGMTDRVQRARLAALAEIGGDEAALYLLERAGKEDQLAADAFQALGHLTTAGEAGCAALREALARAYANEAHPLGVGAPAESRAPERAHWVEHLVGVLGRLRDPYAAPLMGSCLTSTNSRVRAAAVAGLGRLRRAARGQVGNLVAAYHDAAGDEVSQREIVRAMGQIGGPEAYDFVLSLRQSDDLPEGVRAATEAACRDARDG